MRKPVFACNYGILRVRYGSNGTISQHGLRLVFFCLSSLPTPAAAERRRSRHAAVWCVARIVVDMSDGDVLPIRFTLATQSRRHIRILRAVVAHFSPAFVPPTRIFLRALFPIVL